MSIRSAFAVVAALAACTAEDQLPDGYGQLEAHVDGDPIAPYHTYHLYVVDTATTEILYEDSLEVDQVVGPVDSRFTAALPANRPLIVGVVATDANDFEVGGGSVVIQLAPKAKTSIDVQVLAYAAGRSGTLDAKLSDAQLPSRVVFAPQPATNYAGGTQRLFGKLAEARTSAPITDAVAVDIDSAVAPMFLVENGGVTTQFVWTKYQTYPASAKARIAYLDGGGRGWVGSATTKFAAFGETAVIDAAWTGQIHASGKLANTGRWMIGPYEDPNGAIAPCGVAVYADANGDGMYSGNERAHHATVPDARFLAWTAPTPITLANPAATVVGGALVASAGGAFDTFIAIDVNGGVHVTPWATKK